MAISNTTFSDAAGAVSDLFAGIGAGQQGALKARGLQIQADATRLQSQNIRMQGQGLELKARGDIAEGQEYGLASDLANQNAAYTATSTAIQQMQQERAITAARGTTVADTAGAGFASSGSSLALLRDSASQGALTTAVLGQQGLINEAGYKEQAASYDLMKSTANATAVTEKEMAGETYSIANQNDQIAAEQDQLAVDTQKAADAQATGDFIGSAVKGAAAVASLFML